MILRDYSDDIYPKLYQLLPYLLRNAIENYEQRLENERLGITLELERNENAFIKRQISKLNADNLPKRSPVPEIIGESIAMKLVYLSLQKFANQPIVLIEGDRGTGKGLIAKALHRLSDREKKPFVKIPR
jgi:DNA-binding NtrC family response regulator